MSAPILGIRLGAHGVAAELEKEFRAGAVVALRRRADRQRDIAKAHGSGSGEAAIALRIAVAIDQAADDIEGEARK
jgi:hypothetical protein